MGVISKEDFINLLMEERGQKALKILKENGTDFSVYSCNQTVISLVLNAHESNEKVVLDNLISLIKESNEKSRDFFSIEFERRTRKDDNVVLEEFFKAFDDTTNKKRLFILMGETGVGKSYLIEKRYPNIITYACNSSLDPYTLCYYLADKDGTGLKPYETPFLQAVKNGNKVLLDEGNESPRDTLMFIQGLTDEKESVVIGDQLVKIHPDFRIIMTANPPSRTDERNPLGDALLGRAIGHILELTDDTICSRLKVSKLWLDKVRQLFSLLKANRFSDIRELDYRDFDKLSKFDFQSQLKFKVCQGDVENIRSYKRITELGEFQNLLQEILMEQPKNA
jgi:MoxR-like ATPase